MTSTPIEVEVEDTLKVSLKDFNIPTESWEQAAEDRTKWRCLINKGASQFEAKRICEAKRKLKELKARAKGPSSDSAQSDFTCSICNRQFRAKIGFGERWGSAIAQLGERRSLVSELHTNLVRVRASPASMYFQSGGCINLSKCMWSGCRRADDIKPLVLKELRKEITPVIQVIFERSLETGQLPKDWTSARVSPLFKKGDKSDPANYRPISLTCILCKVMEHIVASNLSQHLNRNNVLYGLQHGFREKRSCETQLIELVEELSRKLSNGHQVDLVLLDFSKAFDKVNHFKLLFKLSSHGVKGQTLKWISSFLGGRTQAVVLEGECSPEVPVISGVPQGSVFGTTSLLAIHK